MKNFHLMEESNANTNRNQPTTNLDNEHNGDGGGGGFYKSRSQAVVSDLEMIALQVATYTSLKDLLPPSQQTSSVTSPSAHNSSWNEIPIRNPLVKQAALAYLQPMMSPPPETGDKGLLGRLRDGCGCRSWWWQCECFSWVNEVALRSLREVFWWERRRREDYDDEEDDDKVD